MPRDEVRRVMALPPKSFRKARASRHETDAFHGSAFQVFYGGDQPAVDYIELSRDSLVRALYRDLDVFATPAEQVVTLFSREAPYDPSRREFGYSYIFPAIQLSLWRPALPQDDEAGRFFSTIGVGRKGYYDLV
jgi:hypothetical protein